MIAHWLLTLALASPRDYHGPTEVASAPEATDVRAPQTPPPPRPAHVDAPERSRSERVPAFGPVRVRWALDASITAGAGVPALVLARWVAPQLAAPALPSDPPELGRVDAIASGRYAPRAATASDVLLGVSMAAAPLVALLDGHWSARSTPTRRSAAFAKTWGTAVLIEAEALALTTLFVNVMKFAVARPRPYTTLAAADVAARDRAELAEDLRSADRSLSFPSGHGATAFAAVTSLATILTLDAPKTRRAKVAVALVWTLGLLAAGTTAALRVVAGKHYPSDVIAGSAIGAGVGVGTALMHGRRPRRRW